MMDEDRKSYEADVISIEFATESTGRGRTRRVKTLRHINPRRMAFLPIPIWLFRMRDLPPSAKLLYGRLALYANERGEAWPSRATLAKEFDMTEQAVGRLLAQLRDAGLIESRRRAPGMSAVYTFLQHPAMYDEAWDRADDSEIPNAAEEPPTALDDPLGVCHDAAEG